MLDSASAHAMIGVKDLGRAREFYSDRLGLTVVEEYDLPELKTVGGIARHESGARGAWCKDPDGNILEIAQLSSH